jgi:uncharacterized membrane protein
MEYFIKITTSLSATLIEGIAAILIAHAVVRAVASYWRMSANKKLMPDQLTVRLDLGKSLALSLEFLLAADILRTAITPTWEDIGKLSAIAALRTLLNYFLERELKRDHSNHLRTTNGARAASQTIL